MCCFFVHELCLRSSSGQGRRGYNPPRVGPNYRAVDVAAIARRVRRSIFRHLADATPIVMHLKRGKIQVKMSLTKPTNQAR